MKNQRNLSNKSKVLGAAIFVGTCAILMVVFFGDPFVLNDRHGGMWLRNVLYDFQTLFAGIAAVVAAWWTVNTMEETDDAAEGRHREQLALGNQQLEVAMRGDKIAVERAIHPQLEGLKGRLLHAEKLHKDMLEVPTIQEQIEFMVDNAYMLRHLASHTLALLERPQLVEGSRLFDGLLAYKLLYLRDAAQSLLEGLSDIPDEVGSSRPHTFLKKTAARIKVQMSHSALFQMITVIPEIVGLMEETADIYQVREATTTPA
ncbi:hypothetical protein [Rhizobium sp. Rhizsp82]|uniref:hypothetical protein n=1 Tax=Rhizobium sp. Rhizsp82 TaxID=3243057 RepID=UPI0039B368E6